MLIKIINLTISERLYALSLLNQFKGDLETLTGILDDIKIFRIDDEEWEKANKKVNTIINDEGKPVTTWTWDDDKLGEKEIKIDRLTKDYLVNKIKEANDKGQLTIQDRAAITLSKKLTEKDVTKEEAEEEKGKKEK